VRGIERVIFTSVHVWRSCARDDTFGVLWSLLMAVDPTPNCGVLTACPHPLVHMHTANRRLRRIL
jgi:hypothetical protein